MGDMAGKDMNGQSANDIPVIDIAAYRDGDDAARQRLARTVDDACRNIGFLVIKGHGVPAALIQDMLKVSQTYFALPESEKLQLRMPSDRYRGYTPMLAENLAASLGDHMPPDIKESFSIGPVDVPDLPYYRSEKAGAFFAPNMWPQRPADMQSIWTRYYREMERLATELMRIFALALELPEHWFDKKIDRHISNFSVLHYPDQEGDPEPGQLRAGAHTDYGSLTILYRDSAPGGLQVQALDGGWIDAPDVPGSYTINIGDLMAEWTNDRWRSTMHRVANPPTGATGVGRLSMAFFHQPNYDAVVECLPGCCAPGNPLRYAPTTSGEHVTMKIMRHRMMAAQAAAE